MRGMTIDILVVEDNAGHARLIAEALRTMRIPNHVSIVRDGVEALDFLQHAGSYTSAPRPELILLDLSLPRKDGYQVLAEIKSHCSLRRIPVVVLTGSDADQDVVRAYELHANCYITKPLDFANLTAVVQSLEAFWFTVAKLPPAAA